LGNPENRKHITTQNVGAGLVSAHAITLITLVITIILLIILAGVVINLSLGDNGLIFITKKAKNDYLNAQTSEEDELNNLYSEILVATGDDSKITISVEDLRSLIQEEIKKSGGTSVPTGSIISQMGVSAPDGYLICDGTVYNISDYQTLANYIKEQFGKYDYWGGDGETTFAVPNLQGEFLRGYSTGSTASKTSGVTTANVGLHQAATYIPQVFFCSKDSKVYPTVWANGTSSNYINYWDTSVSNTGYCSDISTSYTWSSRSGTVGGTTRPTNTSVLYCIKY
jgi:microcystin-dependent protein